MSDVLAEILRPTDREADFDLMSRTAIELMPFDKNLSYLFLIFAGNIALGWEAEEV